MNRRNFLTGIIAAGVSSMILPAALTYKRSKWIKRASMWIPNPEWVNARYEVGFQFFRPGELHALYVDRWNVPYNIVPVRGNQFKDNGELVPISPYIEA